MDESSAGLNPARLAHGLAAAARRRGVAIAQQTPVDAIERAGAAGTAAFLVRSPRGDVRADRVFVATGAYTGPLTPRLRRRVIPIGSYVIATEPLDASTAARLIPRGRMVFDSNNFLHYYRLTPDRRMLFGGRAAFVPETERTVRDSAEILRRDMVAVFPQLRDAGVAYAWGGTIDFTFDMLPHAGALDGLFYAMGFAGHGVAMATYLGERMGSALTASGAASEEALPTGPLPGAPLGLYGGDPWFLPLAGAWYRLLDWAS